MSDKKMHGLALRKLRELKGFSRKEAGLLLELGSKTVEKFENGRTELPKGKVIQIVECYGLTYDDFLLVLEGKTNKVRERKCQKKRKVIDNNFLRRSYQKKITKEVKTLQALRKILKVNQYKASALCGYHKSGIGHIENGRIELSQRKIEHIVKSYGFTMDVYNHHFQSEKLITDIQDECINIIQKLPEENLKVVYALLQTFNK